MGLVLAAPVPISTVRRWAGAEQSHASSSLALWDTDADRSIPVSGWAGVPKYPKLMLASGKKLYCLTSDNGQLPAPGLKTRLGYAITVCRSPSQTRGFLGCPEELPGDPVLLWL